MHAFTNRRMHGRHLLPFKIHHDGKKNHVTNFDGKVPEV